MAYYLLLLSLLIQGLSGLAGGLGLMSDPSGRALGIPLPWLAGTPFSDYFVPGLILFTVLGIFPLVVGWGLLKRRAWAHIGSILVGTGLIIWILVEILMIGYQADPPLQAIYGSVGLMILGLAAVPSVRQRLSR